MSAERLQAIIEETRRDLASAENREQFWQEQYEKYRETTPDLADSCKTMRDSVAREVELLSNQTSGLIELQHRYAELESKRAAMA